MKLNKSAVLPEEMFLAIKLGEEQNILTRK